MRENFDILAYLMGKQAGEGGGGGGGYGYTKLAEQDFAVNTSSTTATTVGTMTVPGLYDMLNVKKNKIAFFQIRDNAGKRNGRYFGNDLFLIRSYSANYVYSYRNAIVQTQLQLGIGIYPDPATLQTNDSITIKAKYNASQTTAIDGTFHVEAYALDWPDGVSPFAP